MRDENAELPWHEQLGLVHVEEKPILLALYRDGTAEEPVGQVVAWAVAMPDGSAVVVPLDPADNRPILTTLRGVRRRWAPLLDATLVKVAGRETLPRAA